MLSSLPSTPTMPPCAQAVALSSSARLASTTTGRWSASSSAVAKPPRPAPTTTTGATAGELLLGEVIAVTVTCVAGR